jgi:hypothetical protein
MMADEIACSTAYGCADEGAEYGAFSSSSDEGTGGGTGGYAYACTFLGIVGALTICQEDGDGGGYEYPFCTHDLLGVFQM